MPAPAVAFVSGSIRMKLPVARFLRYSSTNSGWNSVRRTRPISFSASVVVVSRRSVSGLTRYTISPHVALTVRVVCLTRNTRPSSSGASAIQTTIASMARSTRGTLLGCAIMSPRLTSTLSARHSVTDCGGNAKSRSGPKSTIRAMRERSPGRQHDDLVAGTRDAGHDLSGVAAKILVGSHDALDGKAEIDQVGIARDVHGFEMRQQRHAGEPRHAVAARDDVVAGQRAHRDEREVGEVQARGERAVLVANALEHRLVVADQVHLVDGHDDARHAEQRHDEGMPLRLRLDAELRVDEDDRQVRRRRAGGHVARVLHVAGRVGDDETPPRRREVAVRDVDRDALLALGAKAVGDQRQVERTAVALAPSRAAPRADPRRSRRHRAAAGRSASTCRRRRCPPS